MQKTAVRVLQVVFAIFWGVGYLGNGILILYIEWSFLRQSFIQVFNPLLHLQVLGVLFTNSLFWAFLAMAVLGYYTTTSIERYFEQDAKRTEINAEKVIAKPLQTFQERQSIASEVSLRSGNPDSNVPLQPSLEHVSEPKTDRVVEPEVELIEWAIQSDQKIRFSYEKRNGEKSNRIVTPINFKTVERTLCLEGYCNLRRARRTFAVQRMRDIEIISANEAKYERVNSQDVITPYIAIQTKVISAPQSSFSNVTETDNTDIQVKQRPYIKYRIDELERITDSEWNNTKVLSEIHHELKFRARKKALDLLERIATRLIELKGTQFTWSTTTANPGLQNLSSDAFTHKEGLLKHYGYKVGMNGLSESDRRKILDTVFLRPLLHMDDLAYLKEWGEPNTAKRLQKLAESIAAFTRNAKRNNNSSFSKAIQDWETDLAYLRRTYYNNRFSFQYPHTK